MSCKSSILCVFSLFLGSLLFLCNTGCASLPEDEVDLQGNLEQANPNDEIKAAVLENAVISDSGKTVVLLKSQSEGCDVFVNGIFQGKSDLKIEGLVPGKYKVQFKKKGAASEIYEIEIMKGYELTYFISLQ